MKTKKVTRYECEFCRKRGYSAGHMRKHERRCTMNPDRECGMCQFAEGRRIGNDAEESARLARLVAMAPDPRKYEIETYNITAWPGLKEALAEAIPKIHDAADNCPVCVLAALRQAGTPMHATKDLFHCKEECAAIFKEVEASERPSGTYY